jgi:hypothetical protein
MSKVAIIVLMSHEYSNIVVGSSLSAVLFASANNYPILFTEPEKPFRFDYLSHDIDLSSLKLDNDKILLKTFDTDKTVGTQKLLLWERLLFLLSVGSNVPLSNLCRTMRCVDDKIHCYNEYSKIAEMTFDTCHYFYDENATGFAKEKNIDTSEYLCYDWIAFNRGGKHNIDYIETDDKLANQIWFYPSDRIDGATSVKDACVVSTLNTAQIEHFDYSETMARFKLEHEMTSRGMKGPSNGYGPNGKLKHYKFRTTSISRSTSRIKRQLEKAARNIEIAHQDEASLLKDLQKISLGHHRLLERL